MSRSAIAAPPTDQTELELALVEARRRHEESTALLQAAQAIPLSETFAESARAIFDACCRVTGATSGYVALLAANGEENEVLFLESGGLPCTVDPNLPMPIRGLRGVSYETNKAVFDNDFGHSKWMEFMPEGHVELKNVMFAPVIVGGKTVGLIGLANKPDDFTGHDAELASRFGDMAAVALRYARYQDELNQWGRVFEHAEWGVAVVDAQSGSMQMMNPAFAAMHGHTLDQLASKPLSRVLSPAARKGQAGRLAKARKLGHYTFESEHRRKDGSLFPVLLDVTSVNGSKAEQVEHGAEGEMEPEQPPYYVINVQDITERKAAEDALHRSNQELRQYATIAAHQLQEPLRLISSYTQLLARRYRGRLDAEADEFIDYTVGGAERLHRLLEALLVYTEAGTGRGVMERVDCAEVAHQALETLQPRIEATRATVVQSPLPRIKTHRQDLFQLFEHLVANALDAAGGEPPYIRIAATRERGIWRFSVSDQGVGIAPRHQERIFDLFTRLQGPTQGGGTGIGLALCKKLVELHGGRIWVESEEGRGATFNFTLQKGGR